MHRRLISILFFLLTGLTFLSAQEDEGEWFWNKPISKIEFEGLNNVRKSELTGIISSFVDTNFDEDTYNDILDRLYALDLFEDIVPYAKHDTKDYDKIDLVFKVEERPVIKSISFTGNKKIRNGELREKIKIKTSDVYVEGKVLVDERAIRNFYLEKGYTTSKVSHTSEIKDDGVYITFDIKEGSSTVVKEISLAGNTIVSEHTLKSKLQTKEVGFLRDGAFQSAMLEQDKLIIVNYYHERGYIDATVEDVKIESAENSEKQRNELSITFIIQEGPQYIFNGLTITGNKVFDTEKLLSLNKMKPGTVYNEIKFQESLSNIYNLYYENGYMFNDFFPMPVKDTDRHEIGFNLMIEEKSRSHIENIIIKGNTKTKDYVIRREIPIQPGDTFSREKIMTGYRNLMNTQFFSAVLPEQTPGSEQNLVDVVWNVEDQSTTSLQFGFTFSGVTDPDEIPVSGYLKFGNTNFLGEGRSLSASLSVSSTDQTFEISYGQNWIGNLPVSFEQSLSISHSNSIGLVNMWLPNLDLTQQSYYMSYEGFTASLGTGISRRWSPDYAILKLSGGINHSVTDYIFNQGSYVPVDLGISIYANRIGLLNSLWTSFSVDNRDISYDPSKGWFGSERIGWYGLIPGLEQEFFLRSDSKLEGYFTLFNLPVTEDWNFKLVFADYTGLSAIFPIPGTTVSEANRVYIDGMFNGRGWTEAYKTTRGLAMLSNRMELRMPIVPNMLGIDGFWDTALVKNSFSNLANISMNDVYFSFGPGVRFLLPQFPLHLLFAFKYQIIDGQFKWADTPFQFVLSFNLVNR